MELIDPNVGRISPVGLFRQSRLKSVPARLSIAALLAVCPAGYCLAGAVVTDGSVGRAGALSGPVFSITPELGKQVGPNLFHSFRTFNLDVGEVATFSGPANVGNVIARVTGGSSSIDGTVQCSIPGANFFLINPRGVVFGPDAALDVSGSFVVTTADYLKHSDGSHFDATHPASSALTSAAPAAFGFLSPHPAQITVNGSTLSVNGGRTFSLVGGDIQIVGGFIQTTGGRVNLVSAGGAGELTFDATSFLASIDLTPGAVALGNVTLDHGEISASGPGGGRVSIRAASLDLLSSEILAANSGSTDGLGIDIALTGDAMLAPAVVLTDSSGTGKAGPIAISAANVTIDGTGQPPGSTGISAAATSTGRGGDIRLDVSSLNIVGGSALFAGSFGAGDGGSVAIVAAGEVSLAGGGSILAPATTAGNAGNILVSAHSLNLTGGATISATTDSTGNAGNITIKCSSISMDDIGSSGPGIGMIASSVPSDAGGRAGHIDITADSLLVREGTVIDASTQGLGAAGSIAIHGGAVTLDSGSSFDFTGIDARSSNQVQGGPAGSVAINGASLQLLGGSAITVDSANNGAVGSINVNVSALTIDGGGMPPLAIDATGLLARSTGTPGATVGGSLTVQSNLVTLLGGGQISVSSTGAGVAGTLSVTANQSLVMDGHNAPVVTGIYADSVGAKNAGTIQISTGTMLLYGGAEVSASSFGSGGSGALAITATQSLVVDAGGLANATGIITNTADGNGQPMLINVGSLSVLGGAQLGAGSFGAGNAGGITINASAVKVEGTANTTSLISASAFGSGNAGTVNINAPTMAIGFNGSVSAGTSGSGSGGVVNIAVPQLVLNGVGANASIDSLSFGTGDSGIVNVTSNALNLLNGGNISASTASTGRGGMVNVTAPNLLLDASGNVSNTTGIFSQSIVPNSGPAGTVHVQTTALAVRNDAFISTGSTGSAPAGGVTIDADTIVLSGGGTIASDANGSGPAGGVTVHTRTLQIFNGGWITSDAFAAGAGGNVNVTVSEGLLIDSEGFAGPGVTGITANTNASGAGGNAGNVTVGAGSIILRNNGQISSDSQGGGSAGIVTVSADTINILTTGIISSGTFGSGPGSDVIVTARQITLDGAGATGFTGITAQTNGIGNAGAVRIGADSLHVLNGGEISSTTFAAGAGGQVQITATNITLDNKGIIDSASTDVGAAGILNLHVAENLTLTNSRITSESVKGSGGGVEIFAGRNIDLLNSRITAQAPGEGGAIQVTCPGTIDLRNSQFFTKAGNNGGDMTVDPSFVILENSRLSANGGNNGGNIIVRPNWLLESQSSITATGTRGVGGTLQITPDYNLTGALLSLPVSLSEGLTLQPTCAADIPGFASSFIVTGRGAEPLQPGGWTPSLNLRLPGDQ